MDLKPGVRLKSAVDDTEVIVVCAPRTTLDLRCGGEPMLSPGQDPPPTASLDPALAGGTTLGKRFADETTGLEVLCTRGGTGTLTVDGVLLTRKDAKPLPASD